MTRSEHMRLVNLKHGMTRTPTYQSWIQMRRRCNNPNHKDYKNYGGRGIRICSEWDDFATFFRDMGIKPFGASIERINNSGIYEPGNCRWANAKEQARNRRTNVMVTVDGITMPIASWADAKGIPRKCIEQRIRRGIRPDLAISNKSQRGKFLCRIMQSPA